MIFLVLSGKTLEEDLREIIRYRTHIDGVEVRADFLEDPAGQDWRDFFRRAGLPAILTLRRPRDGGHWHRPEEDRRELFLRLLSHGGFRYVDLEEDAELPDIEAAARAGGVTIIRSFHDFKGVPENLAARIRSLARMPGDIPKAAGMPRSCRDLSMIIEAFDSLRDIPKILLGMGEFGFPVRVLAPRLGSYLTFASPGGDRVAPGLIDPETLDTVYRYHKTGPATRIYGIIGNPILHSRSPHIHNAAYDRLGLDAVYVPFHVDRAADFMPVLRRLEMGGLSVTVPFKEEVIPLCARVEEAVRVTGACNTIVPGPGGLAGYNTDVEGFLAPLRRLYGRTEAGTTGAGVRESGAAAGEGSPGRGGFLAGIRACVVGAGGSARSAVYALAGEGARVLVLNRTPERAARLAGDISAALGRESVAWAGLDGEGLRKAEIFRDIVVNTTTMGMHPWEDLDPLEGLEFAGTETVYDIVYSPRETKLLRRAAAAGCRVVYGEEMLLSQAYRQFLLYTGRLYPNP